MIISKIDSYIENESKKEENFDQLTIKIDSDKNLTNFIDLLVDELRNIPQRDNFTVNIDSIDTNITSIQELSELLEFGKISRDDTIGQINIVISKDIQEGLLSIYNLQLFTNYYKQSPLENLVNCFKDKLNLIYESKYNLTLVLLDNKKFSLKTDIIFFTSYTKTNSIESPKITANRRNNILKCMSQISYSEQSDIHKLVPEDFYIVDEGNSEKYDPQIIEIHEFWISKLNMICAHISLLFISNFYKLQSPNNANFKIEGYKTFVERDHNLKEYEDKDKLRSVFDTYQWSYESDVDFLQRIKLARNVITVNSINSRIRFSQNIIDTIRSNYSIYLKDKVDDYFKLKNEITSKVMEVNNKIFDLTHDLLNTYKQYMAYVISFAIGLFITYSLKISNLPNESINFLFTKHLLIFVLVINLIFTFIIWLKTNTSKRILNNLINRTETVINDSYSRIIDTEEINNLIKKTRKDSKKYFQQNIAQTRFFAYGLIFFFTFSFVTIWIIFNYCKD